MSLSSLLKQLRHSQTNSKTQDDLNYGFRADLSFRFTEDVDSILDPLVDDFMQAYRDEKGKELTPNQKNLENHRNALNFLVSNLLRTYCTDPVAYLVIERSNAAFGSSESKNPYGVGRYAFRRCFKFLSDQGYVEVREGYNDSSGSNPGFLTRCRAFPKLLEILSLPEPREEPIGEVSPGITRTGNLPLDSNSVLFPLWFQKTSDASIRMKDDTKQKRRIEPLPEAPDLERMQSDLEKINGYLMDHWTDLCLPEDELRRALGNPNDDEDQEPTRGQQPLRAPISISEERTLFRVFNNGTYENGGRFYGGWWQRIPSEYRNRITINWHPVSEIDYSSMQPAILYAMKGLDAPEDSYAIDGIEPTKANRDLLKKTFLQVVNAKDEQMRAPKKEHLPDGMSFSDLKQAIKAKHEPIKEFFNTGIGVQIQRVDSDIAETVMLTMMEHGQLVLPVHDSFIVRSGNEDLLAQVMSDASKFHIGRNIETKTDPIWHYEITTYEDWVRHIEGAVDISEVYIKLVDQPEFSGFRQRRDDFLNHKGQEWAHTRRWFNG